MVTWPEIATWTWARSCFNMKIRGSYRIRVALFFACDNVRVCERGVQRKRESLRGISTTVTAVSETYYQYVNMSDYSETTLQYYLRWSSWKATPIRTVHSTLAKPHHKDSEWNLYAVETNIEYYLMLYSSWAISYLSYNWQESQFSIPRHTLQRFDTFASTTQSKTDLAEIESENTCSRSWIFTHFQECDLSWHSI